MDKKVEISMTRSSSTDVHDPPKSNGNMFFGNLDEEDMFALYSNDIKDPSQKSQLREEDKISMFIASLDAV